MEQPRDKVMRITGWVLFWLSSAGSWALGEYGWMSLWSRIGQMGLCILGATIAIFLVATAKHMRRVAALALAGLAVGQWRLLESALTIGVWSVRGFGP
jgi:hypothetical protein